MILDKKRVFVVRPAATGPGTPTQVEDRPQSGAKRFDECTALMDGRSQTRLDGVEDLFNSLGEVGEHPVGALDLYAGEGRGARGVRSDVLHVREDRLELAFSPVDQAPDPARDEARGNKDDNVRDGDGECRERDHAKTHLSPGRHVVSRTRAC